MTVELVVLLIVLVTVWVVHYFGGPPKPPATLVLVGLPGLFTEEKEWVWVEQN